MKEGWTYKKLGDCFVSINNGANIKQVKGASGIPITRIETLSNNVFNRDRMGYANIEDVSPYCSYVLNDGDILMSHINSMKFLGRAVEYNKEDDEVVIHGMNLLRLVPSDDILSSFAVYQFQTDFFRNQIKSISHQSVNQASFNITNLKGLDVLVPPMSVQQRIVDRLDAAFETIDKLKANAEKQLAEAQTLFQKSLAKAMKPKEGWEERLLSEIVHPNCSLSYGIVQPGDHVENGIPVVRPVDFNNQLYVKMDGLKRTKPEISDAYQRTILKGGEILLCVRGTTGTMGIASDELIGCNVTRGIVPIYFDVEVCTKFVYYELLSPSLQDEIAHKTTGAALKQINIKDLRNLHMSIPPLAEQQRIVERLDALSENIRKYEEIQRQIISECDALKQALLRKVFE